VRISLDSVSDLHSRIARRIPSPHGTFSSTCLLQEVCERNVIYVMRRLIDQLIVSPESIPSDQRHCSLCALSDKAGRKALAIDARTLINDMHSLQLLLYIHNMRERCPSFR
jgi:hypothetical protein